jgi:hypothetical protein
MAVSTIAIVWGIGFGIGIAGAIVGSVGWVGTTLLIFCVSGEWVRAPPLVDPGVV